jgi:hypothetical protein
MKTKIKKILTEMDVLEVSAKQFREKQGSFFDIADSGRQVIIKRYPKPSYILNPVVEEEDDDDYEDDNFVVTPELLAQIEIARQQMREGKYTECKTYEDSLKHLESL